MSVPEAAAFVAIASAAFVFCAWKLGPICFALSPLALAIVFGTRWRSGHLDDAVLPRAGDGGGAGGGGWRRRRRRVEPVLLGLAIGAWVGGFDVLYACQDVEFDRAHGLRSIPARFGVRPRSPSRACST